MSLHGLKLDREMRRELDDSSVATLRIHHTDYRIDTTYAAGQGYWRPGDGDPGITFDGPADANAAGRCVANRVRYGTIPGISYGSIHPTKCGWCDYPKDVLLAALDHATWRSQYVVSEHVIWPTDGSPYVRSSGRAGEYDNPTWADFFLGSTPAAEGMAPSEKAFHRRLRGEAIARAAGYESVPA